MPGRGERTPHGRHQVRVVSVEVQLAQSQTTDGRLLGPAGGQGVRGDVP